MIFALAGGVVAIAGMTTHSTVATILGGIAFVTGVVAARGIAIRNGKR